MMTLSRNFRARLAVGLFKGDTCHEQPDANLRAQFCCAISLNGNRIRQNKPCYVRVLFFYFLIPRSLQGSNIEPYHCCSFLSPTHLTLSQHHAISGPSIAFHQNQLALLVPLPRLKTLYSLLSGVPLLSNPPFSP